MKKKYFYHAFKEGFPEKLEGVVRIALNKACESWEKSGLVEFEEKPKGDSLDFLITTTPLKVKLNEKGVLVQPLARYSYDVDELYLNSMIKWRVNWWEFYNYKITPSILAHELGHFLGFIGHSTDPNSVMYEFSNGKMPTQRDFEKLALILK